MGNSNKLLLKFRGHTIIEESALQLSKSQVDRILVITGHDHRRIRDLLKAKTFDKINILYNENFEKGRLESVKKAIKEIYHRSDAALFMVADKPTVKTALIDRAISLFKEEKKDILYIQTPDGRGHPIIFSKFLFDELLNLEGHKAIDRLISEHSDSLITLEDDDVQIDIDTENDYQQLLKDLQEKR
jgi:molybdenum cofactor cytidylyltransferase